MNDDALELTEQKDVICPSAREHEHRQLGAVREMRFVAYVRGWNNGNRNAVRRAILQLPDAGEDCAYRSRNVLPSEGRADGHVVPRVRASFGARPAQDVCKDAFIEINKVV